MSIYPFLMLAVAVYVARPAFTGKGKLMHVDFVKEGKEKTLKKGLRGCYSVLFVTALVLAVSSYFQTAGFKTLYQCTFTEDFTAADGRFFASGETYVLTLEEAQTLADAPAVTAEPAAETTEEAEAPAEEANAEPAATEAPAATAAPASQSLSCLPAASESSSSSVTVPCEVSTLSEANEKGAWLPGEDDNAKMKFLRNLSVIAMIVSVADIVFMMIFTNRMTDKEARKAAAAEAQARSGRTAARNGQSIMPKGAFEFTDEDKEVIDDGSGEAE